MNILFCILNVTTDYLLCRTDNPYENIEIHTVTEPELEVKALLDNVKDLPTEIITSINYIIKNYKLFRSKINAEDFEYFLEMGLKTEGLSDEEERQMYKLVKKIYKFRNQK